MKLTFITNLFPPHYLGGYELLCAQVRNALQERGHEIQLLTSNHGTRTASSVGPEPGIHRELDLLYPFDGPAGRGRLRYARITRRNRRKTRRRLAEFRPDLVFAWSQLRLTLGATLAARDLGLPVAYTMNDEYPLSYLADPFGWLPRRLTGYTLDRLLFRHLDVRRLDLTHTVCISQSLKDRLVNGGLPLADAKVIHQGIPVDQFPSKKEPGSVHDPIRLLFLGQLHPHKGVHTLMEAMAILHTGTPGRFSLSIVGEGPVEYEGRLREMAANLDDSVTFFSKVDHGEVPPLYRDHDIFVFPSTSVEALGLTYLEAMASGLPVVGTAGGGHGEVLKDGHNALVFPEDDARALADALQRLYAEPELRRKIAVTGSREVHSGFDVTRYVDDIEAFLERAR